MHFAAIFTFLSQIVGPLVIKVLAALGLGAVSYMGINLMLSQVKQYVISSFGGTTPEALSLLGLAKVDVAVNIVLAAVTARAVYAGMNSSGIIKKFGFKGA